MCNLCGGWCAGAASPAVYHLVDAAVPERLRGCTASEPLPRQCHAQPALLNSLMLACCAVPAGCPHVRFHTHTRVTCVPRAHTFPRARRVTHLSRCLRCVQAQYMAFIALTDSVKFGARPADPSLASIVTGGNSAVSVLASSKYLQNYVGEPAPAASAFHYRAPAAPSVPQARDRWCLLPCPDMCVRWSIRNQRLL